MGLRFQVDAGRIPEARRCRSTAGIDQALACAPPIRYVDMGAVVVRDIDIKVSLQASALLRAHRRLYHTSAQNARRYLSEEVFLLETASEAVPPQVPFAIEDGGQDIVVDAVDVLICQVRRDREQRPRRRRTDDDDYAEEDEPLRSAPPARRHRVVRDASSEWRAAAAKPLSLSSGAL